MKELYNEEYRRIMRVNLERSSMGANRIDEIVNFARGMQFERIGIAHCITFHYEADIVRRYLAKYFEVFTVDCKYGRMPQSDLLGGNGRRVLCNPAGQAEFLNQHHTQLNISMGLCVGHDMIFSKHSKGLVTNLFDKDFTNNNSPEQAVDAVASKL